MRKIDILALMTGAGLSAFVVGTLLSGVSTINPNDIHATLALGIGLSVVPVFLAIATKAGDFIKWLCAKV